MVRSLLSSRWLRITVGLIAAGSLGFAAENVSARTLEDDPPAVIDSPPPADPGPSDPGPTDPGPTDPGPTDPGPTDPGPTDPGPTDPGPTDPGPTDPGPTDPGTTTDAATTTDPGTTTDAGTSTDAAAVTDPGTTTDSGSGGVNSSGANQASAQTTSTPTTTPAPTTTAPCVNGVSAGAPTCGNNASTQIALVTQNCNSTSSGGGPLKVDIKNADGSPLSSQIVGDSVCLNYSQIFQIVQQLCVNCQLVVQNFYSSTTNVSTTNQTVANGWTGPLYLGYCMPKDRPVMRGDGTVGWLVILQKGQPDSDPVYKGATLAPYDPKSGYGCPGTGSAPVPAAFTFTVPTSLIGQFVNLCIQPADPTAKPVCHSVKIDSSASVTLPVSANVAVSVTKNPVTLMKPLKRLTKKQLAKLAARYSGLASGNKTKKPAKPTTKRKQSTVNKKVTP